jgi:hypothetical protein
MALSSDELSEIDDLLLAPDAGAAAFAALRQRFPHLSLTRCDSSDVDTEEPFRTYPGVTLYLVDGASHCWQLTRDPARATGLLIAQCKVSR